MDQVNANQTLAKLKEETIDKIKQRHIDGILEEENAQFLIKLIENAETSNDVVKISALGMSYKKTGFNFDIRLEKEMDNTVRYLQRNDSLSFNQPVGGGGTKHKLIIGDNYPALLNLLIEYKRKIKVIYIDPPYGKDDMGEFAQTNYTNSITRDNLLSMLYSRLLLAKQLLREDGVIFCSIDDRNQAYVKGLFDEIFGERNFVANLCVIDNLKGNNNTEGFSQTSEYCLVYAKNKTLVQIGEINIDENDDDFKEWNIDEKGYWKLGRNIKGTGENAPREKRPTMFYPIYLSDNLEISLEKSDYFHIEVLPMTNGKEMCWNWGKESLMQNKDELIVKTTKDGYNFHKKQRPSIGDLPSRKLKTSCYSPKYSTTVSSNTIKKIFGDNNVFNYTKSIYLIKDLIQVSSDQDSIILDFFAGSGTTGHAVLELNKEDGGKRKFILVTNNESSDINPNGIAYDVTSKRLKRIMSGECYDGNSDFKWIKENKPYGDSLEVSEIKSISAMDKKIFETIDEKLYGKDFGENIQAKIDWVCREFELTCTTIKEDRE